MQAYIPFPDISPDLFSVTIGGFELALRWYALAYVAGLILGWRIVVGLMRRPALWPAGVAPMRPEQVENLLTAVIIGVILGGRLGYVLFYQPLTYLADPLRVLRVWEGGMAFHGGLVGVVLAIVWFCRKYAIPLLSAADAMALATPPGLFFGRVANFINAELWGRPSSMPWAVAFPGEDAQTCPGVVGVCARHPSQLYEAGLEGLVLGLLLLIAVRAGGLQRPGWLVGIFLTGYGLSRFVVELFRQADAQFITPDNPMGYVWQLGQFGLSMGQILSLPMILLGLAFLIHARRRAPLGP